MIFSPRHRIRLSPASNHKLRQWYRLLPAKQRMPGMLTTIFMAATVAGSYLSLQHGEPLRGLAFGPNLRAMIKSTSMTFFGWNY